MAQVINTNISSLNAQRNLNTSQSALATSLQRLSSGLRINSAKDDAAGLAISERFTSQIRGMDQASRNANDGISLAQTAEGALSQIGNNLQRMRELAVQSANATNSQSDRNALQSEVSELTSEIQRVASGAQFNGVNLLDGTFSAQTFQVGANNTVNDRITVSSISDSRTSALGASYSATVTSSAVNGTAGTGSNVQINGANIIATVSDGVSTTAATGSAKAWATAINGSSGTGGVTATAVTNVAGVSQTAAAGTGTITLNGVTTATITQTGTASTDQTAVAAALNAISAATGVTATATGVAGTGVTLTAADGRNVTIGAFTQATGTFTSASTGVAAAGTNYGTLTLTTTGTSGITAGGTVAAIGSPTTTASTQTGTAISNISVASASSALTALSSIDAALTSINSTRASLGAYQNRFASAIASLQTTSENFSASRSRIQDADFAAETASLTRGQILQQAGTAMLAQANGLPNTVLSLLRG